MKQFIEANKIFLSLYFVFVLLGTFVIAAYEKGNEILYFNSLHNPFFNSFFTCVTRIAEAPMFLLIIVIAIRFSYGKGLVLALNAGFVFGVTAFLKYMVFSEQTRPSVLFEHTHQLNFVQGVEVFRYNSFPSGHTSSAFGLFFMLSLLLNDKRWSFLFFMLAVLVGVSRVYLLEHFFRDVYAGSLVGVVVSAVFYLTFVRSKFYENISWRDKKLI